MNIRGKVYIVGAGPGDPELLTLKGARLLGKADFVMYAGSLVNEKILEICPDGCEMINSVSLDLDEQVRLMTGAVREGRSVVRLHTGDPCLYGAISEQMERLGKNGIECEIVPGVSSFQGAAARLGIEYTIPGGTQTLICTRMAGRTPVPDEEDLSALASHRASLVVFLSSGMTEAVVEKCVAAGVPKDTPAAWIYRATWEDERSCLTTLGDLPRSIGEAGISRHALIIIGECLRRDPGLRSLLYTHGFEGGLA
ncbi:MAG: precorrin-4 C(11)-methyltransferase [Synergistaceae bacterium]|jgi:precorrin-4/cobalt-precorrin-4 C11-methyltransferase|nr:precorrin-4 C(11)-methyltransferase [Synergistaceae bacterium]